MRLPIINLSVLVVGVLSFCAGLSLSPTLQLTPGSQPQRLRVKRGQTAISLPEAWFKDPSTAKPFAAAEEKGLAAAGGSGQADGGEAYALVAGEPTGACLISLEPLFRPQRGLWPDFVVLIKTKHLPAVLRCLVGPNPPKGCGVRPYSRVAAAPLCPNQTGIIYGIRS